MRFERYPLDEHICKFRVGSTNMDINYMRFGETTLSYDETNRNTILDYMVDAKQLKEEDRIFLYAGQNYSVTGIFVVPRMLLKNSHCCENFLISQCSITLMHAWPWC